jgi:hypothetical protein
MSQPVIPLVAAALAAGAAWYYQIDESARRRADRLATAFSYQMFGATPDRLSAAEAHIVLARVRQHFAR